MSSPPLDLIIIRDDGTPARRNLCAYLTGWDTARQCRTIITLQIGGAVIPYVEMTLTTDQARDLRDWLTATLAHMEPTP